MNFPKGRLILVFVCAGSAVLPGMAAGPASRQTLATTPAPALAVATGARIDPDDPPKGVFLDDWYVVTLAGKRCGHMHSTARRFRDRTLGRDVVESVTKLEITVGRDDQTVRIGTTEQSVETLDGRPVSFLSRTDMSLMSMEVTGRVVGEDEVAVTTRQLGQTRTQRYRLPKGAVMTWGSYREQVRRGLAVGTRYTIPCYAPAMAADRTIPTTFEVLAEEDIDLYGRVVRTRKTRQTMQADTMLGPMKVETIAWVDEAHKPLKLEMEVARQRVSVIHCDKAIALQEIDPPELMAETLIPAQLPAGAARAESVTYRITRREPGDVPLVLPETPMQKVERNRNELIVTVTRGGIKAGPAPSTSRPGPEDLKELRAATPWVNTDDPAIRRLAEEAAGGETDPVRLVPRLRAFVTDYVKSKDMSVGFGSASEVARSRQGDCSEHAVLLAALARACGLPSRGVSGVVHSAEFAGRRNVFVWHMWTQVYVAGRWVDTDPALGQDDVDPTHIAMGIVNFGDAGLAEMTLPIWHLIGQIRIEVVRVGS